MKGAKRTCVICEKEFTPYPGKPGFIHECGTCGMAGDIERLVASDGDADGNSWSPIPASTRQIYGRARVEPAPVEVS
jgi:hypothetical protein